jgi:hypothetical protein
MCVNGPSGSPGSNSTSSSLPLLMAEFGGGSGGHRSVVLVVVDWAGATDDAAVWEAGAAAAAMALGMVGLAVEVAAKVEAAAMNKGGWTEDGLACFVLAVVAGAAAAWEAAGSAGTSFGMIRVLM